MTTTTRVPLTALPRPTTTTTQATAVRSGATSGNVTGGSTGTVAQGGNQGGVTAQVQGTVATVGGQLPITGQDSGALASWAMIVGLAGFAMLFMTRDGRRLSGRSWMSSSAPVVILSATPSDGPELDTQTDSLSIVRRLFPNENVNHID